MILKVSPQKKIQTFLIDVEEEMDFFLKLDDFNDFNHWKTVRNDLIKKLKPLLLSQKENEISNFFSKIENEINNCISSNDTQEILKCLLLSSILYHFQRNQDNLSFFNPELAKKLILNDRLVANAVSKTFFWFADDSNEFFQNFKKPINLAKKSLKSNPDLYYNALIMFKRMKKHMSSELLRIIYTNYLIFIQILKDGDLECRKLVIHLFQFLFSRVPNDFKIIVHFLNQQSDELLKTNDGNNIAFAYQILNILLNSSSFHSCPNINYIISTAVNYDSYVVESAIELILHAFNTFHTPFAYNEFITMICKNFDEIHNPFTVLKKSLIMLKGQFDINIIYKFISQYSTSHNNCVDKSLCTFHILKFILKYDQNDAIKELSFDIINNFMKSDPFEPCKHFFKCVVLVKQIINKSENPISYDNIFYLKLKAFFDQHYKIQDPYFKEIVLLYPTFLEFFPCEKDKFVDFLSTIYANQSLSDDIILKKRLIKTLNIINNDKSKELIYIISMIDRQEQIRILAIKNLYPSMKLAADINIFQYLNDSSFKVRRQGIKLLSKLYQFNPFDFKPLVIDFLQQLFAMIITSTDIKESASYASFLADFTKFFKEISDFNCYSIISVALRIINSSLNNKQRKLIFEEKTGNKEATIMKSSSFVMDPNSLALNEIASINPSNNSIKSSRILSPPSFDSSLSPIIESTESASSIPNLNFGNFSEEESDTEFQSLNIKEKFMSKYCIDSLKIPSLFTNEKKSYKEPNKSNLYILFYSKYLDKRDKCLLQSIANLGPICHSRINDILSCYYNIFKTKTSDNLLIGAVKSLSKLSLSLYNGLNLRLRFPSIIEPLINILSSTSNKVLAKSILQLFGSAFDNVDVLTNFKSTNDSLIGDLSDIITNSPSFYTDVSIKTVLKYTGEPTLTTLKIFSLIVKGDPIYSAKYIPKISEIFIHIINKCSNSVRDQAFKYLEIIADNCPKEFVPLLHIFLPVVTHFLENVSCIRFLIHLSYFLKDDFLICINDLFVKSILLLRNPELESSIFQALAQLVASMIVYQHAGLDVFLRCIEQQDLNLEKTQACIRSLTAIIQSIDIQFFSSRLIIFGSNSIYKFRDKIDITNYLVSISIFGDFPISRLKVFFKTNNLQYQHFGDLEEAIKLTRKSNTPSINKSDIFRYKTGINHPEQNSFKVRSSKVNLNFLKDQRIRIILPKTTNTISTKAFFADIEYPNEFHIHVWIKNVVKFMITRSPSTSVRALSDLVNMKMKFLIRIFPVAFLSCWNSANESDREYFSKIINYALKEHQNIHHIFFDIIKIADKSLFPINIDILKVLQNSKSNQDTLYFIQKQYLSDPHNEILLKAMIDTSIKMGRFSTARGLLKGIESKLILANPLDIAKWNGELGDWDKALFIYKKHNAGLPYILKSLEAMSKFDEILTYEDEYTKLPMNQKMEVMDHFLWAFQLKNESQKVNEIISMFDNNWTMFRIIFSIYLKIINGEYEKAQELINLGYDILVTHKSDYPNCEQSQIEDDHDMAKLLVESQEVINFKLSKSDANKISSFFTRRIKYFKRSRFTWERTICLRKIVIPIETNLEYYSKIIKELRKSRLFSLIGYYFGKYIRHSENLYFHLEYIKIIWEYGLKREALSACKLICDGISYTKDLKFSDYYQLIKRTPFHIIQFPLTKIVKSQDFTPEMKNYLISITNLDSLDSMWKSMEILSDDTNKNTLNQFAEKFPDISVKVHQEIYLNFIQNNHFIASINNLTANYIKMTTPEDYGSLKEASKHYKTALRIDSENVKYMKNWANNNAKLFAILKDQYLSLDKESRSGNEVNPMLSQLDKYSKNSIEMFLKLCLLKPADSLEYASHMFSILCSSSSSITSYFLEELSNINPSIVIKILPLVTPKLDHDDPNMQSIIRNILIKTGLLYFQEIYFALNIYVDKKLKSDSENNESEKSRLAREILIKISYTHPKIANDAEIFINGMVHSAITWFELWIHHIEIASKLKEKYPDKCNSILKNLFHHIEKPRCELDRLFINLYGDAVKNCLRLIEKGDESSLNLMWAKIRGLYVSLKDRINKLSVIFLSKVSEELLTKKKFEIFAPGTSNEFMIDYIDPILEVLETQQHPRVVSMATFPHGKRVKYLLKGNEDLRLDERLMQLFALINGLLSHSCNKTFISTSKGNINSNSSINSEIVSQTSIIRYAVIPLTKSVGLIKWVNGADTFHQLVLDNRDMKKIGRDIENQIVRQNIDIPFISLNSIQRYEIFQELSQSLKAQEVFQMMWLKSPSAGIWMSRIQKFTTTAALMSIVGYIIGLGDRHPSNIMIQRDTGSVIHIDFGESFESAILRKSHPERVPFRLTRMVENALEGSVRDGLFKEFAYEVMQILRNNINTLTSQLSIFVEEPLTNFNKTGLDGSSLIERCRKKLLGLEFPEYSEEPISVTKQVDILIEVASNPFNYIRHYPGWCPFW